MNSLIALLKGVFPKAEILLVYYCGSISYGLNDDSSDKDVTVVLDGFKGNLHLNIGEYDFFVFSKERFIQRQTFDSSIIAYHKAAADNLMSINDTLVYIDPSFQETLDKLLFYDDKDFILSHIEAEVEYGRMRYKLNNHYKSHYHIFRIRGMVDHYEKTGKYELVVEEPWLSKMMDFKSNWNNDKGKEYVNELKEQLEYLDNYRNEMINNGLE
ncbi:MAG: hypothetical protein WC154_00305 [Candidatus Izemoplasmatales bacterium]